MKSDEVARVEAARQDPGQFAFLYEANFELVYAYLARRVKGRAEVEDLTSEVFRRALSALPGYEPRGVPFASWLLRIAANAVVDRARRTKRRALAGPDLAPEPSEPERLDAQQRARLFRAVAELPREQRRVIELRFAEERPVREIAAALGKSEGAVKQLQLRALAALRKRIGSEHV
ncbi:MAG TPA: sigma-70 family RNA polymerase sigma factor [Myxococcota bacterium]|nr:sigma-70 family RNA polymerase sigma factor [Myxococcota bacterium]